MVQLVVFSSFHGYKGQNQVLQKNMLIGLLMHFLNKTNEKIQ